MNTDTNAGLSVQIRLIHNWLASLKKTEPASFLIETHISWVLLSGEYAYKIKKALHYDFIDYSDLSTRRFYCQEEIRLNRRTAPQIYLDVVQIGGSNETPVLNTNPALEYAVKMRHFDASKQLDHLLEKCNLTIPDIDSLAGAIADFHLELRKSPKEENSTFFGSPEVLMHKLVENLHELKVLLMRQDDLLLWDEMKRLQLKEFSVNRDRFCMRETEGFVRECHGDMHMGNLVKINGNVIPFDGIEFDPKYRWLDIVNDIAFAFMDLLHFGKKGFAWRVLNLYLQKTGDYEGMALLPYYTSYYASVRAKVHLIRQIQQVNGDWRRIPDDTVYRRYMILANDLLRKRQPALVITTGLPGSGKTVFANAAVEKLPGICLRSDIERKRFFSNSTDPYSEQARQQIYDLLLTKAAILLQAGLTVIVDASFIRKKNRDLFRDMARKQSVPFTIAVIRADKKLIEKRLEERTKKGSDASDADITVLMKFEKEWEPLTDGEKSFAVEFINDGENGFDVTSSSWHALYDKLRIPDE